MQIPDTATHIGYLRRAGTRQVLAIVGATTSRQAYRRLVTHLASREAESSGVVCVVPRGETPGHDDARWEVFENGRLVAAGPADTQE